MINDQVILASFSESDAAYIVDTDQSSSLILCKKKDLPIVLQTWTLPKV